MLVGRASFAQNFTQEINYQGKLTDTNGVAVPDGTYNMRFWLLDAATGPTSTPEWTESLIGSNRVQVTSGLFSIMLGSSSPLTSVNFNQPLYLGVEIGGTTTIPQWDGEMSPRKVLGAVPAAFEAKNTQTFAGIATTSFLRSDLADTMSALLTFSGGFVANSSSSITELSVSTTTVTYLTLDGQTFTSFTDTDSGLTNTAGVLTANISEGNLNITGGTPTDDYFLVSSSTAPGGFVWSSTSTLGLATTDSLHDALTLETSTADYLTLSGQEITLGLIDLANDVTGTLADGSLSSNVSLLGQSIDLATEVIGTLDIASTSLSVSATGLTFTGGDIDLDSLYTIPLTASTTAWNSFYTTPSTRITAGTGIDWSTNTLNVTGLTTSEFASADISQWTNDVNYLTSVSPSDLTLTEGFVFRGNGSNQAEATSTLFIASDGKVGIGTSSPSTVLDVYVSSQSSTREQVMRLGVSDAGNDAFFFANGTSVNGRYQPAFAGYMDSTNVSPSAQLMGLISSGNDTSAGSAVGAIDLYVARTDSAADPLNGAFSAITGKNVLSIRNHNTQVLSVSATGNLGIGSTSPSSRLTVAGDTYIGGNFTATGTITLSALTNGLLLSDSTGLLSAIATSSLNLASSSLAAANWSTGYLLQASSTAPGGFDWVATSTLGITGSVFSDYGADNQIPFMNGTSDFDYSSNLTFNGTDLGLGVGNGIAFGGTRFFYATTTLDNIAIGEGAGEFMVDNGNTGDTFNVFLGYQAGRNASSTGPFGNRYNNFIGYLAGSDNTGIRNNIMGRQAGFTNAGNYNNLFGYIAGGENTGDSNNIFGYETGWFNTGSYNNLSGYKSGYNNTGSYNNFLGYAAGHSNTGSYSEFIGYETGALMNASSTVAIGGLALRGGSDSFGFGTNATTTNNVAIGYGAGYNVLTGGDNNILIGYQAADSLTTGANNLIIGYDVEAPSNTADGQLNIGNILFGESINETGTTISDGGLAIGTSSADTARLSIQSQGTTDILNLFETGGEEVFTVLESGNVGIGTTSPVSALSVIGDVYLDGGSGSSELFFAGNRDGDSSPIGSFAFQNTDSGNTYEAARIDIFNQGGNRAGNIDFYTTQSNAGTADFAMRISQSQNLVLGTTSETARLTIQSISTEDILNLFETGGTEVFTVLESGNVGIGDSSPSYLLTVGSGDLFGVNSSGMIATESVASSSLAISNWSNGYVMLASSTAANGFDWVATSTLGISGGGGIASLIEDTSPQLGGNLDTNSNWLSGDGDAEGIYIHTDGDVTVGTSTAPVAARFNILANGSADIMNLFDASQTEVLTVQGTGEVGIGTTGPLSILHVVGDEVRIGSGGTIDLAAGDGDLYVQNELEVDGTAIFTGNVGIGTTSPTQTLTVDGTGIAVWGGGQSTGHGGILFADNGTGDSSSVSSIYGYGQGLALSAFGPGANDPHLFIGNGEVGIGTTTALSAELNIQSSGSQDILNLFETSGIEVFTVLESGDVGIGTSSPSKRLDVFETVADAQLRISYDGSRYGDMQIDSAGTLIITSSGNDVQLSNDNLWVCESGSCPAITASSTAGYGIFENGVYFGNGYKIDQTSSSSPELGVYDDGGALILIFD